MKRALRIGFWISSGILLAAALLGVIGLVIVQSDWFRERLRAEILTVTERATGSRARIDNFRFGWKPLQAEILGFTIHGRENGAPAPFLQVARSHVTFSINWRELREDPVKLQTVTIERPHILLHVNKEGLSNLPRPTPSSDGKSFMEDLVRLAIGHLQVDDGIFQWNQQAIPFSINASEARLRLHYDAERPGYVGDARAGSVVLDAKGLPKDPVSVDARVALLANQLEVLRAEIAGDGLRAKAHGSVSEFMRPSMRFQIEAEADPKAVARFPAAAPLSSGSLSTQGVLTFGPEQPVLYEGTARATGVRLRELGRLPPATVSANVRATEQVMDLRNVKLTAGSAQFHGAATISAYQTLKARGDLSGVTLREGAQWLDLDQSVTSADARISGPVEIEIGLQKGAPYSSRATLQLSPMPGPVAVQGEVIASFDQRGPVIHKADIATPSSKFAVTGARSPGYTISIDTTDLAELASLAPQLEKALADAPLTAKGQALQFNGKLTGDPESPLLQGHLSLQDVQLRDAKLDRVFADISLSREALRLRNVRAEQGQLEIKGQGGVTLHEGKVCDDCRIDGLVTLTRLPIHQFLRQLKEDYPVTGLVSGEIAIAGTANEPLLNARLEAVEGSLSDQPYERLRANLRLDGRKATLEQATLDVPGGKIEARGAFTFNRDSWQRGSGALRISSSPLPIGNIRAIARAAPALTGTIAMNLAIRGAVNSRGLDLQAIDGAIRGADLAAAKAKGEVLLEAKTHGDTVRAQLTGSVAGSSFTGSATAGLSGNYPVEGRLQFEKFTLATLRNLIQPPSETEQLQLDGEIQGGLTFAGNLREKNSWNAEAQLEQLEIHSSYRSGLVERSMVAVRNRETVRAALRDGLFTLQPFHLVGEGTDLLVSGQGPLSDSQEPVNLRLEGDINLNLIETFEPSLDASGSSQLSVQVRGTYEKPDMSGRLMIRDASFFVEDVPNGLDRANGEIVFNGQRATIESLTAHTGGGTLSLSGYIGFGGEKLDYRLRAQASEVRVRYPEGMSTTFNADLSFTGSLENSLLGGNVTILRSVLNPRLDLASVLANSSRPMVTPSTTNPVLRGMRFDVNVKSAPNARFETSLARELQAEVDQRLRGSPQNPVLLGRILINQGEINFFGNRYFINRGEISFVNPVRIEPVINFDLQTRIRAIEVSLTFSGPINRLNINYRSDPPLQLAEIVSLLATGQAPLSDPTSMARQEVVSRSYGQIGATALLGQALTSPFTSRLQRFFGVSRIRLNPQLAGFDSEPQARLTLEQQISQDVVLIYTTNLTRGSQQSALIEWDFSREWLVIGGREENGLFGVDFLFRKRF